MTRATRLIVRYNANGVLTPEFDPVKCLSFENSDRIAYCCIKVILELADQIEQAITVYILFVALIFVTFARDPD